MSSGTRQGSDRKHPGVRGAPSPQPSPPGRGGRTVLGASGALLIRRGRGGAAPTEEHPRAGGWARAARSARSSGMGRGGLQPPQRRVRPRRLLAGGEGAGTPSKARCAREGHAACADAPQKNIRGRVGGPEGGSPRARHRRWGVAREAGTPSPPALTLGAREPEVRHRELGAPAKVTPRALIRRGRGGGAPTADTRSPSQAAPLASGRGERPHPNPLPRGEGAGTPSGVRCAREGHAACADPAGAWGRSPHMKNIRGRVGGPEPRAAQARPGWGVGAQPPQRRERPHPRARESRQRESRQTSRRLAQSTMRSAVGAACSRGRKWPAG